MPRRSVGFLSKFETGVILRPDGRETLSENEMVLSLLVEQENGRTETPKARFERISNEWKMAGPYEQPQKAP